MDCKYFTRRETISLGVKTLLALLLPSSFSPSISHGGTSDNVPVSVMDAKDPYTALKRGIEAIGGLKKFISKNDIVLLKPNIGWDRTPEQAANTDPSVVVSLVRLLLESGAREVRIFDRTCNEPRRCYINSGIEPAVNSFAKEAGVKDSVKVYHVERRKFTRVSIKNAEVLKKWPLYRDALEVDKIINVPVAKHHSLAGYTLSLKNIMGIMGGNRGQIHWQLSTALADLNGYLKTDLAVIDGTKVLLRNGPSGGNVKDVSRKNTLIVSPNPVAADAVAVRVLFGVDPADVSHIREAWQRGLGPMDMKNIDLIRL